MRNEATVSNWRVENAMDRLRTVDLRGRVDDGAPIELSFTPGQIRALLSLADQSQSQKR